MVYDPVIGLEVHAELLTKSRRSKQTVEMGSPSRVMYLTWKL